MAPRSASQSEVVAGLECEGEAMPGRTYALLVIVVLDAECCTRSRYVGMCPLLG